MSNKFNPSYKIYKPSKDPSKGSATSWEYNDKTKNFFLTIAKQADGKDDNGNSIFQWKDQSETVKLDLEELSEIMLVIHNKKPHLGMSDGQSNKGKGLFHQTKDGNTIVKLYQIDSNDGITFGLEISSKKTDWQFWAGQRITPAEAGVILIMCQRAISDMIFNH
jgi:hypothetical protein